MVAKLVILSILAVLAVADDSQKLEAFKRDQVSPDVVSSIPEKKIEIKYKTGKEVDFGNELTPKQVLEEPQVSYAAEHNAYYSLIFTDPDAPSRTNPKDREFIHWLVVNIPGTKVSDGEIISNYVGSGPAKGSDLHRYVFLLYKQPEKLKFTEPKHSNTDGNRAKFNTEQFAKKYNLGKPIAGNFFQAKWDDTVPASLKKLGF